MGHKNNYLDKEVPALYRKQALDIMIYTFIDAQRMLIPSLSVMDCAKSFLNRYKIDEGDLSLHKIETTYYRTQKEIYADQKTKSGGSN